MNDVSEPPARPAGWYADPQQAGELRYWDGAAWGKQFKGAGKAASGPRPVGRGFGVVANLLGILLTLAVVAVAARVALYVWGFLMIDDAVASGDLDKIRTFDDTNQIITVAFLTIVVVAGVCWMVWQHRAARAVPGLERTPAMHALSWIIPIGALWLPFQNVRDLWRRCAGGRTTATLAWWWTGWLVAEVGGRLVYSSSKSVHSVGTFKPVVLVGSVVGLVTVVTGVLAILIVRVVSAGVAAGDFVDARRAHDPLSSLEPW